MTSALQRSVQSALERLGIPSVEEYTDADYMIDIAIPEHQIAIEVDGPHHYAANMPERSLGPTLLKHRLLRKLGWRLITVSHCESTDVSTR
jgi:very-short-patch-repair endonuclease